MADELHVSREHPRRDQTPMPTTVITDTAPESSASASHRSKWSTASGAARVSAGDRVSHAGSRLCRGAGWAGGGDRDDCSAQAGPGRCARRLAHPGPDIPTQVGAAAGCQRSDRNYPSLLAQYLGLKAGQVRDVSCSGATSAA